MASGLPERRARRLGIITLAVSSLDEEVLALRALGLNVGPPMIGEKVKVVMIKDQDGNSIAFAETSDPGLAQ